MLKNTIKLWLQYLLPKKRLSILAGLLSNVQVPWVKNRLIQSFIRQYAVNMHEAQHESLEAYASFNAFFIRDLKPGLRPIAATDIVSPVDGFVSELGRIQTGQLLQAKGRQYTVDRLLLDHADCDRFMHGAFVTLYLSPKDYHRVHMPCDGALTHMQHLPGRLFSVQPMTTRHIPNLFASNERLVLLFDTPLGAMAVVFVGAVVVGKIGTCWQGDLPRPSAITSYQAEISNWSKATKQLKKGDEVGYFKLGSTVILLFEQAISWMPELQAGQPIPFSKAIEESII